MGKNFLGLDGLKHFWSKAKSWIAEQITTEVAAKIAEIIANAPEDLDTLKEIADWILSDTTASAELITRVSNIEKDYLKGADKTELQGEIDAIETLVGTLPESAASTSVVDYITEHQNVRKQITAFSVYGQAGINLYIDSDKKVRLYILSDNAMSIIQYANRVRNKEVIDKIVVPYKKDNIRNTTFKIDTTIDIEDAKRRLKLIVDQKVIDSDDPIIPVKYERMLRLTYGFTSSCIKVVNDVRNEYELREDNYKNYKLIRNTIDFERQLSVIYSRMKDNYIIMNLIERDKDDVDVKETKQKTNRFCGQVKRMLKENMFEESKISTGYYLKVDEQMKKILTGDSKDRIERVFNRLVAMNLGDKEIAIEDFREFIRAKIKMNKTIKKSDFTKFDTILELKSKWDNAMDAGLITLMLQDVDLMKISAGYVGKIYKAEMKDSDWMKIADETYKKLVYIKKIVSEYKFLLEDEIKRNTETLGYQNNYNTQRIYKYLCDKHTRGKKTEKNTKQITVKSHTFDSVDSAAKYFNVSRMTINRWVKKGL